MLPVHSLLILLTHPYISLSLYLCECFLYILFLLTLCIILIVFDFHPPFIFPFILHIPTIDFSCLTLPFFAFSQRINTSFIFVFQGIADHYFDLSYKDRIISFLPMSHIAAQLFDIHVPIYLGNCLTRLNRLTHFLLISSCLLYCVAFKNQEHLSSLIISKHIISYLISSHYIISYHVVSQHIRQQYFTSYHPPVIPCFLTSRFPILPPPATI